MSKSLKLAAALLALPVLVQAYGGNYGTKKTQKQRQAEAQAQAEAAEKEKQKVSFSGATGNLSGAQKAGQQGTTGGSGGGIGVGGTGSVLGGGSFAGGNGFHPQGSSFFQAGGSSSGGGGGGSSNSMGGGEDPKKCPAGQVDIGGGKCMPKTDGSQLPPTTSVPPDEPKTPPRTSCFAAGTKILTPEGPRDIDRLQTGQLVYSVDPATYELIPRRVAATHHHTARPLLKVELTDGRTLWTTDEHPFYDAATRSYKPAGKLVAGDLVVGLTPGARAAQLSVAKAAPAGELADVYNITMEGEYANYVADGVLVHNKGTGGTGTTPREPTGSCFAAGTRVATPDGQRAIESLNAGDKVYAVDPNTMELVTKRVLQTHRHLDKELLKLTLSDGRTLQVTEEHPFFDPGSRRWRAAGILAAGDRVVAVEPLSASVAAIPMAPPARLMPDEKLALAQAGEGRQPSAARELTVASVERLGQRADVFNVTVEGLSDYLAEGVLVHNMKAQTVPR